MLSKCVIVTSLCSLLLFAYGLLINITKIEENRCKLTYMYEYPQFVRISFAENDQFPAYGLYAYSEGQLAHNARNMMFRGAPVIFIPGNAGSYKQARSLASVALRKGIDNGMRYHLDYFTVDLNEQYSGLYGGVLNYQVDFVRLCIQSVLNLYKSIPGGPTTVVLIGHSMGGKIAQAVAASPGMGPLINSIVAISSPMDAPVISLDHYLQNFYNTVNNQWKQNRTVCTTPDRAARLKVEDDYCLTTGKASRQLDHILLVTVGGGIRDTMVHDSFTNSLFSDVHSMTYNVPKVWLSVDHQCAVWCLQFVLVMNRFLHSLLDFNAKRGPNKFVEDKDIKLRNALFYLKNVRSVEPSDMVVKNDVVEEDWIEDIRRNFQLSFEKGLQRTRVQMIILNSNSLYRFMKAEVTNLDTDNWIFGCTANEIDINMRYCSTATPLHNYSSVLPYTESVRRVAQVNLHTIKAQNPSWTHLLLKLPRTDDALKFTVDINNYDDRVLDIQMPKWYSFGSSLLLDDTALGASFYKLRIFGMDHSYQTLAINIDVRSCNADNPSVVANISVPWTDGFTKYSHYYKKNHSVIYVYAPYDKPSGFNSSANPIAVDLHLNPSCRYTLSSSQSLSVMMARIVQQFGQWIPAHCVAILLLAIKHQVSVTPENESFKCGKLHTALSKSTPFFIVTASRVFTKMVLMFKVLPQPEQYDSSILVSVIIHGASLAILLISTAFAWAAIVFCGNFVHKILIKIVCLPIPALSSTLVSCIEKFPMLFGGILMSIALASCGSAALICACVVYFIILTKMYEDYLEHFVLKTAQRIARKLFGIDIRCKGDRQEKTTKPKEETKEAAPASQNAEAATQRHEYDNVHHGLININFHLPLFLLLVVVTLLNFPSFLTWAKHYRLSPSLKPDASLIPSIVILGSLSVLWQMNVPKNMFIIG
ncbi:GPI inositol-deacylase isoform X2 [Armigeres subalbatus]|uniref:GPI inositol-deacylase isoform X2 n=1 Tax=Armigeres subalbatus TaxID=124917 RepID=UPI002ED5D046